MGDLQLLRATNNSCFRLLDQLEQLVIREQQVHWAVLQAHLDQQDLQAQVLPGRLALWDRLARRVQLALKDRKAFRDLRDPLGAQEILALLETPGRPGTLETPGRPETREPPA